MVSGRLGVALFVLMGLPLLVQCGETEANKPGNGGGTSGAATGGTPGMGGTSSIGGKPSDGGGGTVSGAGISGYANYGGHTAHCIGDPCGAGCGSLCQPQCATYCTAVCGDPCQKPGCEAQCPSSGGAPSGGAPSAGGEAGQGGQGAAPPPAPPPAAPVLEACYELSGNDAAECLPPDDALVSWLSVPAGCNAHLLGAAPARKTWSCCYRLSCTP